MAGCTTVTVVEPAPVVDAGEMPEAAPDDAGPETAAEASIAQSCTPYGLEACDGGAALRCYGGDVPPGDVGTCVVRERGPFYVDTCCERVACLRRPSWSCNPPDGGNREGWWCPRVGGELLKPSAKACVAEHDAGSSATGLDYCCD